MIELRALLIFTAMLLIPGWFGLAVTGSWRRWPGLQSWLLALALGIAFYPVFFYGLRFVLPPLTLGPYKMTAGLLVMLGFTLWRLRRAGGGPGALQPLEWVAVAVFAATLLTRYWIVRDEPYPAWTDSLHHTLLTHLTAVQGQLPRTVEPYFPVPLDQYHLGLYALSATVQWLAQVPAHTALLWTAQGLNALCAIGVYLVLDKKVGRIGAITGAVVVGLLSHQPAFYANWGRFTQLSSQVICLVAWLCAWQAAADWRAAARSNRQLAGEGLLAALLIAGTFLLHFRVAAFFLPLVAGSALWEIGRAYGEGKFRRTFLGVSWIAVASLLMVLPALVEVLQTYISTRIAYASVEVADTDLATYYSFPLSSILSLGVHQGLLIAAAAGTVVGLLRRNSIVVISLIWTLYLFVLGYAYVLQIPLLNITNLGAVLIMLYLPVGLVIGAAAEELIGLVPPPRRRPFSAAVLGIVLLAGLLAAPARVTEVEPYRFFVTPADVAAMDWITYNTPPDAYFAVNTYFWLSTAPHGTDAGYWIPYLTGRQTTAGMMNSLHGTEEHWRGVVAMSAAAKQVESDPAGVEALRALGVDYIYIGRKGNFQPPGLNAEILKQIASLRLVYERDGVAIFAIE